jgi:RNA polymerase sigma-70 factor (ECF subfamily)
VTRNKHREMHRRKALPVTNGSALAQVVDPAEEFWEADYRRHLMARALELAQREFQPTTWEAFHAVVIAGRDPDEVAAELGLSVNAVYVARSRVIRRLRQELAGVLD